MSATRRLRFRLGFAVLLGACLAGAAAFAEPPRFVATPLGTFGGTYSWAAGINRHGAVTGFAADENGSSRAFVTVNWLMMRVGTGLPSNTSYGQAVSDNGLVAGTRVDPATDLRAFLDDGRVAIDIGTLGGFFSIAIGVNDQGMVVGYSITALDPHTRGFLYHNGTMMNLGTLGGDYSTANGINSAGQVTGSAGVPVGPGVEYGNGHAYRYTNGTMIDLGTLGGSWSVGHAINERGDIAGSSATASAPVPPESTTGHACVWRGEAIVDLGTLGGAYSRGLAINAAGDVVGEAQDRYGRTVAFLYTDGSMYDLNELAVTWAGGVIVGLANAHGINDAGQIAANACTGSLSFTCKAYRLDPVLTAVEYHHAEFNHYFVTTSLDEIFLRDSNATSGWKRTGMTFAAFPLDLPHVEPMCRFSSGQTFAPRSSHFYTPWRDECDRVRTNPDWQFEGDVFGVWLPADWGGCEPGTERLFRLYNGGRGGAPNHRYTTNIVTRMSMVQRGWIPEGIGELGVIGCVPKI